MLYSVVLISAVWQNDSVIDIHILFHCGLLQDAIQQDLVVYPTYIYSLHLQISGSRPPPHPTLGDRKSMSVSLSHRQVHLCHILDSTHK